jgi:hypothetical protein
MTTILLGVALAVSIFLVLYFRDEAIKREIAASFWKRSNDCWAAKWRGAQRQILTMKGQEIPNYLKED